MTEKANWWLAAKNGEVDACAHEPGRDVDIFRTTTMKTMADIWTNNTTDRKAVAAGDLSIISAFGADQQYCQLDEQQYFCRPAIGSCELKANNAIKQEQGKPNRRMT